MKKLLFVVGSKNDLPHLKEAQKLLKDARISHETIVVSAHRDIETLVDKLAPTKLTKQNIGVVIAIAHSVANLPAIAAGYLKESDISVIGVGLTTSDTGSLESLLSTISIPKGIPLMNCGINAVGLHNAALCAIKILRR